uniref:Uncharacterized protein n=1 Tax=viral metagenome TaxID=1070528 RepID=A0A6C0DS76_9ZZZZ
MEEINTSRHEEEYEIVEKEVDSFELALKTRMLEVAYHESFYAVKRKINLIESLNNMTITEKNIEKQQLARIMNNVYAMKSDVNKLLYGGKYHAISEISKTVIEIEVKKYMDLGMTISQIKQSLDNRLKIK